MSVLKLMHEGGWLAWLSVAFGLVAALASVIALVSSRTRAGFGLSITALLLTTLSAAAGIAGTLYGRVQVERALAFVEDAVERDHLLLVGSREASSAALVGVFVAAVPLVLSALAAMFAARSASVAPRRQGVEQVTSTDAGAGRSMLAAVFIGIAALAVAGAWVTAHRAPPQTKYAFDEDDQDAWQLAGAVERVETGDIGACEQLESALQRYRGNVLLRAMPRQFEKTIPPPLEARWRALADGCIEARLRTDDVSVALLDSPLVQDQGLFAAVVKQLNSQPPPPEPEETPDEKEQGRFVRAMKKHRQEFRFCFESQLKKEPELRGKLRVRFVVSADGVVREASEVTVPPFPSPEVSRCVLARIKRIDFGAAPNHEPTEVEYPFAFEAMP